MAKTQGTMTLWLLPFSLEPFTVKTITLSNLATAVNCPGRACGPSLRTGFLAVGEKSPQCDAMQWVGSPGLHALGDAWVCNRLLQSPGRQEMQLQKRSRGRGCFAALSDAVPDAALVTEGDSFLGPQGCSVGVLLLLPNSAHPSGLRTYVGAGEAELQCRATTDRVEGPAKGQAFFFSGMQRVSPWSRFDPASRGSPVWPAAAAVAWGRRRCVLSHPSLSPVPGWRWLLSVRPATCPLKAFPSTLLP